METVEDVSRRLDRLEQEVAPLLNRALVELETIRKQNDTQLEIMTAWNNAKGFVRTIGMMGTVAKWVGSVSAALAVILASLHWGGGK
ncbi:MAG TPA: hypothetical protein VIY48_07835 [Candidatus Paceibacterota bacterium]